MTPEFRRAMFKWNYDEVKDGAAELCIPLQVPAVCVVCAICVCHMCVPPQNCLLCSTI